MSGVRQAACQVPFDRGVPALMLKIGQYPVHSGGLGVLRSLGRCGVPVYAITEPGLPPAAVSRYTTGRFVSRATGRERPESLVPGLMAAGQHIGRRSVIVSIDDEAAVLVAEHREELSEHFLLPDVAPGLPGRLASKTGLFELCRQHGIPAPASVTPGSGDEVAELAATARFPVVVKNADPWQRRRHPVVPSTTVLDSPDELLALVGRGSGYVADGSAERAPGLILQEYLPIEQAEDWISHLYADADSDCVVMLTGRKVRSWPPYAGLTASACTVFNPELAALAERFCKEIGYSGIGDLDWRLDLRDGQYKLVDFNPRPGNPFRLFETEAGVDVVRALHLDLTGRDVPRAREVEGKRIVVEHVDIPARLVYWMHDRRATSASPAEPAGRGPAPHQPEPGSTEYAWLATDDPFPFFVMIPHALRTAAGVLGGQLQRRVRQSWQRWRMGSQ
ncbi:MAG TPA: hypothetical protein VMU94_18635 [Streptosporangiaceae bacterium]|nr:hypothetical protein [Streptosporangiaceae bacterium]